MSSSDAQWAKFLRRCFAHRVEPNEFAQLSKLLNSRSPITEGNLIDLLLQSSARTTTKYDPLLPLYIDCLCRVGRLNASTALASLLKHSSIRAKSRSPSATEGQSQPAHCTWMTDVRVIQDLTLSTSTGVLPKTAIEALSIFEAIVDWINGLMSWHNDNLDEEQQTGGLMSSPDAIPLFESLGVLLAALSSSAKGLEILSAAGNDATKIRLGQALSIYIPLSVGVVRNRLDALQKEFNLFGEAPSKALEMPMMDAVTVNALDFEASVMDGPVTNSRAGLYLYINAMLVGRPLVDDSMFLNYLTNRYGGQYEVLIEDLITAAFDVLSNAMYRNESSRTMFLFRSFLVNKLPPFLAVMAATSMVPIPMEMCISHALNRVDPNAFPSLSQMFSMQGNTALSEVRQEFLFACALHKLIPEASIERLLGENPMQTLPTGGQYVKDNLIAQINSNPERAEQLISELESMDGNSGAIVGAITEVIRTLCNQKETMTLKNVCNSLSRRPQALDVIMLFRSPRQVLQPLCTLLDSWRWDEDQGENQPVYDEFGSILLLVLAFKHRYDLSSFDLGVNSNDSFVLKLLDRGSCSYKVDDLNDKQSKDLGAWIGALFIAEGISEETMSACSPQEFYLLVATLFDQSLGACEVGKLEFETLKGGFEYLLEPFLLPSLVVALTWLGNHIWESESDPSIALKALQFLINPGSISGDAKAIHQTVLHITARNLEEQLKDVRTRQPSRPDIKPILDALEPYLSFQRIGSCHRSELENWTAHSGGGLLGSLRSMVQSLVLWSTNPEISVSPHSYTHRQLLGGIRMLGAARVLGALVEEARLQSAAGNADLALDIVATMICAPMAESFAVDQNMYRSFDSQREASPRCPILTLRHALNLEYNNLSKIAEKDPVRAEVIVRLSRRVNALISPPSQMSNLDVNDIIQNMHLQGVGEHDQMDIEQTGTGVAGAGVGDDEDAENINQMIDEAAAAAAAGLDNGVGQGMGLGTPGTAMNTSLDEMLNAADMAVENPEFLELDMEEMF